MTKGLSHPLPPTRFCLLQLVAPHTLQITLNRPNVRNALHLDAHWELASVFDYVESEPEIWCSIITGAGEKSFCAGADLKAVASTRTSPTTADATTTTPNTPDTPNPTTSRSSLSIAAYPPSGFAGLSLRTNARKPVIAAVQGHAFGGGMELLLACDIVVAVERATFAMPEVKRGVVAANGGIARLVQCIGYQRAMSIVLTGRVLSAREAKEYGFVNEIVPSKNEAVKTALAYARLIISASPDAVGITKMAAGWALEKAGVQKATHRLIKSDEMATLEHSDNFQEGVTAFSQRRQPRWKSSKL